MSNTVGKILKGALKGALITGGVGMGIPAAHHIANDNLSNQTLGASARFGLLSAIPGALIGGLLAAPDSSHKIQPPEFYLGSLENEDEALYKDLIKLYNTKRLNTGEQR